MFSSDIERFINDFEKQPEAIICYDWNTNYLLSKDEFVTWSFKYQRQKYYLTMQTTKSGQTFVTLQPPSSGKKCYRLIKSESSNDFFGQCQEYTNMNVFLEYDKISL